MEANSGESSDLYGVLTSRNIRQVRLGPYETNTWYGNAAYFAANSKTLGIKTANDHSHTRSKKVITKEKIDHSKKTHPIQQLDRSEMISSKKLCTNDVRAEEEVVKSADDKRTEKLDLSFNSTAKESNDVYIGAGNIIQRQPEVTNSSRDNGSVKEINIEDDKANGTNEKENDMNGFDCNKNGIEDGTEPDFWIDTLYVCDYCFKYTDDKDKLFSHRDLCPHNRQVPQIGTLKYMDRKSGYLIVQIKGYQHELFVQNLCLFGKLFLDNKSVYYNVHLYDVYVVYGKDHIKGEPNNYKPMGFFSKEINAWDNDNNLACICVFPPYQRRKLGFLLIEFLYELAAMTPGQQISGPEFPLSKFGQLSYLKFWSRRVATVLQELVLQKCKQFKLQDISKLTGFRKEDILMTLEYMKVLVTKDEQVIFPIVNLKRWCDQNQFKGGNLLKKENLLLE